MAHTVPGASLQNYNNQLVETLQELKDQREALHQNIMSVQEEQRELENRAVHLTEQLSQVNGSLDAKYQRRNGYDRTIQETEAAYLKILESSQTLLHVMKRESTSLNKGIDDKYKNH